MKKFLVLYLSSASAREQMDAANPESAQPWMAWAQKVGPALVDFGSPLDYSMTLPAGTASHGTLHVGGYSLMQAESADELRTRLDGHPHFTAPGSSIEVHEILPAPGM